MSFVVREARPEDAEGLSALILQAKKSNGYSDAFVAQCVEELRMTEARIASETVLAAESDAGALIGCVALAFDTDAKSAEVNSFFVSPDWQGKGVGRKLWSALQDVVGAAEVKRLHLDADPNAVGFYEALGFRVTGQSPSGSIPNRFLPFMELLPENGPEPQDLHR